ncbi:hypothetical protein GW17_00007951 [Ensete ventricosum]|nr:hypothetical protein GW17_00007951 [Ensete ventricosum]
MNSIGEEQRDSKFFFSFFFLPPSADTTRNRLSTVEIERYQSILGGNRAETVLIDGTAWVVRVLKSTVGDRLRKKKERRKRRRRRRGGEVPRAALAATPPGGHPRAVAARIALAPTKPYACEPSSLSKYPPTKEIDAKSRDETRSFCHFRIRGASRGRGSEATRRPLRANRALRAAGGLSRITDSKEGLYVFLLLAASHGQKCREKVMHMVDLAVGVAQKAISLMKEIHPVLKMLKVSMSSRDKKMVMRMLFDVLHCIVLTSNLASFDKFQGFHDQDRIEFSGPLLSESHKVDELLQKHERHIRQAVRRSWFQKGI